MTSRMRLARMAAGLSANEAARALGLSVSSYQKTEAGAREPRRGELLALAQITGQDVELFGLSSSGEGERVLTSGVGAVNGVPAEQEPRGRSGESGARLQSKGA